MIIGFIGSGNIGTTLARLAVDAGHDVILSNRRGPESLRDLAATLNARAASVTEVAEQSDLVVVAIPFGAHPQIPAELLRGKIVIDTTNYNPARDGGYPDIDTGDSSTGEVMQAHLKDARVVKAFNNIFFKHLATLGRPAGAPDRSALPIAGADPAAKAEVSALLDTLGYDTLDAGPMSENRRWAFGTPGNNAYLDPVGMFSAPGRPASAAEVAALLRAAGDLPLGLDAVQGHP